MKIHGDFPGGNIHVDSIETSELLNSTTIRLRQEQRDSGSWWFWWHFRIDGAQGREIVFVFTDGDVVSAFGPAVSRDGISYKIGDRAVFLSAQSFLYRFNEDEDSVYFAFSLPYQLERFERWYAERLCPDGRVERSILAKSEDGRDIPLLRLGQGARDILFCARHHCCESTASYVLEGMVEELLRGESEELLKDYRVSVIPFVDIDGVERGDQGKDRLPHDHNRDYIDEPIYAAVRAIKEYTADMDIAAYIDLHSPWKWGRIDDMTHIHLGPPPVGKHELQGVFRDRLSELTALSDDPRTIRYDSSVFYSVYGGGLSNRIGTPSSKNYFGLKRNADMTVAIETPYFGNNSEPYGEDDLRGFGKSIARALALTLGRQSDIGRK